MLFYLFEWILASVRQGLHVVALLGLPPRCQESGFRPRKSGSFQQALGVVVAASVLDGEGIAPEPLDGVLLRVVLGDSQGFELVREE
jgi:hypothetical protein